MPVLSLLCLHSDTLWSQLQKNRSQVAIQVRLVCSSAPFNNKPPPTSSPPLHSPCTTFVVGTNQHVSPAQSHDSSLSLSPPPFTPPAPLSSTTWLRGVWPRCCASKEWPCSTTHPSRSKTLCFFFCTHSWTPSGFCYWGNVGQTVFSLCFTLIPSTTTVVTFAPLTRQTWERRKFQNSTLDR